MLLSLGMLMLSATQIYTIFTIQLFAFLNLLPVEANIAAYSFDNKTKNFDDLPSRFGYRLPSDGLKGFLIGARPANACEPIEPPPRDNLTGAFIVLIKRFDCNFDVKVLNAQKAGYKAAIVHNVDSENLISMGSNDLDVMKQIDIPSVFVSEDTATSLKDDYLFDKGGHVILMPDFSLPLEYYLIPFLIIVGICLILIVVFMITKFVQDRHRARRSRLRKDQLKKLPIHKFKKEDTPSTLLPASLITLAAVVQSSGSSSRPPRACITSSRKAAQHSSCLSFHHMVLFSAFVFLIFLPTTRVILHTTILCCLATLSPTTTLQSVTSFRLHRLHKM
ncbi:E3 ubiquitin-protein ligase RNF13 isoform X3 [Phyllopteryx taeniolatus]|uniref:E3 ubiquitin-protein ligase RNF13 isoform X3 n=1 Tax=Phyllopteryx taeniolatus TaxID=161469 RepID=UPI002AD46680|nr:E3 ubiquitin-protein ligase RNF13 isoform X3 [Phyllopteryx taeniolatus]